MEMKYRLPSSRGKPFQSKLLPLVNLIMELRRKRKSYADIRDILRTDYGVVASKSTINSFVKCRQKLLRRAPDFRSLSVVPTKSQLVVDTEDRNAHIHGEEKKTPCDAIEALRRKPVVAAARPVFKFDETKPLTLRSNKSK